VIKFVVIVSIVLTVSDQVSCILIVLRHVIDYVNVSDKSEKNGDADVPDQTEFKG